MKKTKKIISLLLTVQLLLSCALIPSVIATDSVVEEPIDEAVEAIVIDEGESSEELSPVMARGCTGTYIPSSWTVDTTHTGSSIQYVCDLYGWTLSGNDILQNGVVIGHYDPGHCMDGQKTVAHFHIQSDIDNGYGNIHYIL